MLEKAITYTDFDGVKKTETFRFNLSRTEVLEMEMGITGGMTKMLNTIIEAGNIPKMLEIFKDIILKAYGEKSPDGRRFMKSPELSEAFSQTGAFDEMFMELATDATAAAAFINAIIPQTMPTAIPTTNPPIPC